MTITYDTINYRKKNTISPFTYPYTPSSQNLITNSILHNTPIIPHTIPNKIPLLIIDVPIYHSNSSQDDGHFLCSKLERKCNLLLGNLITTLKKKNTRILFQNIIFLELSSNSHTLEITCDSLGHLKSNISCLVETNTH